LLQLGDDLQDVREDLARGSATLFTLAIADGSALDPLIMQLLHFSRQTADRMDRLPNGAASLKSLLRMSWRSLVMMAIAEIQCFCSPAFLARLEPYSSFRFNFLRDRSEKLAGRQPIYDMLFDAFIETGPGNRREHTLPRYFLPFPEGKVAPSLPAFSNSPGWELQASLP
jgi:hypothetical protein